MIGRRFGRVNRQPVFSRQQAGATTKEFWA
jgi:hypothetical protein